MNTTTMENNVAEQTTVTFRTSPETKARLEKLASMLDRSKSYLTNTAVERLLAEEEEFVAAVEQGIAELDAGLGLTTDELKASVSAHIDEVHQSSK
jgi:predicted transcriptional regulator